MFKKNDHDLKKTSARERQIMDIIYQRGEATVAEVREAMEDAPSYSAVRALLRILEEKGWLRHEQEGPRYVYHPTLPREDAARSALKHVVDHYYPKVATDAVANLLDIYELDDGQLDELAGLIAEAKRERGE